MNRRVEAMPPERGHVRPVKCRARTSKSAFSAGFQPAISRRGGIVGVEGPNELGSSSTMIRRANSRAASCDAVQAPTGSSPVERAIGSPKVLSGAGVLPPARSA